jgi:hypothetical protein
VSKNSAVTQMSTRLYSLGTIALRRIDNQFSNQASNLVT